MSPVVPGAASARQEVDPLPREARPIQGWPAGIVTRTVANVIDFGAVVGALLFGFAVWCAARFLIDAAHFTVPKPPFAGVLLCGTVVLFGYLAATWATTGRTYGDHLLGLRVVNARGERLGWPVSLLRAAFCIAFPFGLYWSAVSPTRRSLHDVVLRTSVVYDWTTTRRSPATSVPVPVAGFVLPAPRSSGQEPLADQ